MNIRIRLLGVTFFGYSALSYTRKMKKLIIIKPRFVENDHLLCYYEASKGNNGYETIFHNYINIDRYDYMNGYK